MKLVVDGSEGLPIEVNITVGRPGTSIGDVIIHNLYLKVVEIREDTIHTKLIGSNLHGLHLGQESET